MVARIWILLAAILFSTGGAAIKFTQAAPIEVAAWRSLLAALFLFAISGNARRRPGSLREIGVSCAFAATMLLFVLASRATTAANAVFLQAGAPLYLLLLGPLILGEIARKRDLVTMIGVAGGLLLFFIAPNAPQVSAPDPARGNFMAAIAGMTWALTVLGMRWVGRRGGSVLGVIAFGNVFAVLLSLPFFGEMNMPTPLDGLVLLWLGVFQIGLAYLFVSKGIGRVPAFEASLLFLVEPVLSPLWAWLLHGERPGSLPLIGGALILLFALRSAAQASSRGEADPASSRARDAQDAPGL